MYTGLYVFGGALALLLLAILPIAVLDMRARRARMASFQGASRDLGLQPCAAFTGPTPYWVGVHRGRRVAVGYYDGSIRRPGVSGVFLTVDTGLLPGGTWSARLDTRPARLIGKGPGEDSLHALLTDDVLDAARHLEEPRVTAAATLLRSSVVYAVLHETSADPPTGLLVQAVAPRRIDTATLEAHLDRAHAVIDAMPTG